MSEKLKGIPVSSGIAIGKALLLEREELVASDVKITDADVPTEKERFAAAVDAVRAENLAFIEANKGTEKAEIFEAHLSILEDPMLESSVAEKIEKEHQNAELALTNAVAEISALFEALDDEYLKERVNDFKDVSNRMMHKLQGVEMVSLEKLSENVVVIAKDLAPSDTATMDMEHVLGFATDLGGRTSHTAIMARNMGIPAVVGAVKVYAACKNGDILIVDGASGDVVINPDAETVAKFEAKHAAFIARREDLKKLHDLRGETPDGHCVELSANVGTVGETDLALSHSAEGIGLFRTEFLYMENTHFPTEEEQFAVYKAVVEKMDGKPVIIRTLDIGGDKELTYFSFPAELNPFLGYRAIRFCLDRVDVFKTQLRAILRASAFGRALIMYPMIISIEEMQKANVLLQECKTELKAEGIAYNDSIESGIMVETPAAVMLADKFAKYVDFFSIGTNDLTQYTLAVDRGNEMIQELYNPYHPAVVASIKRVIDASHAAGKWTGMCGEFAGEHKATKMLLGLGLDEFSMSASSIPEVKETIRNTSFAEAKKIADHILTLDTSKEVEDYLDNINA